MKKLPLKAMGIANKCIDTEEIMPKRFKARNKLYSIQFYDYDFNQNWKITSNIIQSILEIFPHDCFVFETKHGMHFISFSLMKGLRFSKAKVLKKSKELITQDYWSKKKYLFLRVSPKWKRTFWNKIGLKWKYKIISDKPRFKGVLKEPELIPGQKILGSKQHLEFYKNNMNFPEWLYQKYLENYEMIDLSIQIDHYHTED